MTTLPSHEVASFWSQFEVQNDGCWIWYGAHCGKRGSFWSRTRKRRWDVHRLSWMLSHQKDVPPGLYVCHTCDVPDCGNPEHLWTGTPLENTQDMITKGRRKKTIVRGADNGRTKVDVETVRMLRSEWDARIAGREPWYGEVSYFSRLAASSVGLHPQSVYSIVTRKNWRWVS